MAGSDPAPRLPFPVVLVVLALVTALAVHRAAGPPPRPADAPPGAFSATRAAVFLAGLCADGVPRPLGSPAAARARDWLTAELTRLGYAPRVQRAFACGTHGTCGTPENVFALREGREHPMILLVAHRDTALVAPGAADDGYGVAALLEIARALAAEPPGRYPVGFLFTDGEEAGLLGAQAFVDADPAARQVGLVVNLDGRGARGPSVLYETSRGNAWILDRAAALDPRPTASSIAQDLYRHMPVDTDLSVFLAAGHQGVNFAYVGDVAAYHTPLDRLDRAHLPTLQQHGDHALALVRAVQAQGLEEPSAVDAVAFDLLGCVLVRLSPRTLRVLALLGLVVVGLAIGRLGRLGVASFDDCCRGFLAGLAALGLTAGLAALSGVPSWFVAPTPARALAAPAAGLAGLLAAARSAQARGVPAWGLWGGVWLLWGVVGLAMAALLPGGCYLFVLPTLAAALGGGAVLAAGRPASRAGLDLALTGPVLVAAPLWIPVALLLADGLGHAALVAVPFLMGLGLTALIPAAGAWAAARPRPATGLAALLALAAIGLPRLDPHFDEAHPMRLNLDLHHDGGTGSSRWLAAAFFGPLPPRLRGIDLFGTEPILPFPWSRRFHAAWQGPALWDPPPGPDLAPLAPPATGPGRIVEARLRSLRGARQVGLLLPPGTRLGPITMEDRPVPASHPKGYDVGAAWQSIAVVAPPPGGVRVRLEILQAEPVQAWLYDQAAVPDSEHYRELAAKRPPWARESHTGDTSWITRRLEL